MLLTDHIALDATGLKKTSEGFLVAQPRIARTGIQTYTAAELGLTDRASADIIKIYRAEDEVFAQDALHSFSVIDVTVDHPKQMVDSKNWRELSVGHTGEGALRDGEFLRCPMIVKDQRAIDAIDAGKAELSVGYRCEMDWTPGTTPGGEAYDGRQTNIRANHLALCDRARGGPLLRIGDHQGDPAVTLKTITFDGLPVADVSPAAEAVITKLQGQLADARKIGDDEAAKVVTLTADAVKKDAEIARLTDDLGKAKITPAQMRDAARAYAKTVALAKQLGVNVADSDDEAAIKRNVVTTKMGDSTKAYTDEHVGIAFDTLTAGLKVDDTKGDPILDAVRGGHVNLGDDEKRFQDAQRKAAEERRNAWKNPTGAAA